MFCFAQSRQATGRRSYLALGGAYVLFSLVAWVHAFEGLFALAALGSIDLLTGGIRDRRRLAVIACALAIGLLPMFLTNVLISGNLLEPPRMLPNQGSGNLELAPSGDVLASGEGGGNGGGDGGDPMGFGDSSGGGSDGGGGSGGSDGGGPDVGGSDGGGGDGSTDGWDPLEVLVPIVAPILAPLFRAIGKVDFILGFVVRTVELGVDVLDEYERLWHIFVRGGRIPGLRYGINQYEVIDLTVLESAPLLGGLVALPTVAYRAVVDRADDASIPWPWNLSGVRQTDLLVVVLGVLLTVIYLPRLPLFSLITMRYILYALPFGLYGVVRLPPVHEAINVAGRRASDSYVVAVVGGIAAIVGVLTLLNVALGEAMQFHALVNLGAAGVVALVIGGRALVPNRVDVEWVATGLGITAGSTTAFLVLAGLEYFLYGPFALGVARQLSGALPIF